MDVTDRPLWTCPRCGHRFVTANSWHSCTRLTLDEVFARARPNVRASFDRWLAMAEQCGPLAVIPQKTRIVFMDRVRFAGAQVLRDRLRVSFSLTREVDRPPFRLTRYAPGWVAHVFDIRDPSELDDPELQALLRESYRDLGQQGALRARRAAAAKARRLSDREPASRRA
jgi:hypothetical protein